MQNKIITILGKTGSGKTTQAEKCILEINKPTIIWDFVGEYKNNIVVKDFTQFQKAIEEILLKKKRLVISCREFKVNQFPLICEIVYKIGGFLLVIEEATAICNPSYIPEELAFCYRYGRHKGIDLLAIAQRPAEINRLITSQSKEIYVFRFTEPRDIEYIQKIDYTYSPETLKKFQYHKIEAGN
jgi:DNA helicase HerA-like ATPase